MSNRARLNGNRNKLTRGELALKRSERRDSLSFASSLPFSPFRTAGARKNRVSWSRTRNVNKFKLVLPAKLLSARGGRSGYDPRYRVRPHLSRHCRRASVDIAPVLADCILSTINVSTPPALFSSLVRPCFAYGDSI